MSNRISIVRWLAVLVLLAFPVLQAPVVSAQPSTPADAPEIQQAVQGLIDYLDSPDYAQGVSWDEHVVLAYRFAQRRDPSVLEFHLLRGLLDDNGLARSAVLSIALRGDQATPTWAQCRDLVGRGAVATWSVDESVQLAAERLAAVPSREITQELMRAAPEPASQSAAFPPAGSQPDFERHDEAYSSDSAPAAKPAPSEVAYSTYFGQLHAHSGLSDGTGTPLEAYTYARDVADLDFFALTDHGEEIGLWPWSNGWQQVLDAANATDQRGVFAALWGFEWSNPLLGHINIINSADYTGALSNTSLSSIYNWLATRKAAFGLFNHPGDFDATGGEFSHLDLYSKAVDKMVGIETWNGNGNFDTYYYAGSWDSSYSYWDAGNRKGWYLGAEGAQDNHDANWGAMNGYRTAVLAPSLTRANIVAAFKARRFYATEDPNLVLDLRCAGQPMGSRLTQAKREFKVVANDKSGDSIQEVRLYRNGDLLQTQPVAGTSIQTVFSDTGTTSPAYYYVIVRLAVDHDGNGRNDEAISSPIWIQ